MAQGKGKTAEKTIDDLLAERTQFELWLSRLDENTEIASEKVRERIRGDYQARLERVVVELGSHTESIADQLKEYRISQADLTAQESTAEDELAEAELRHAVGEHGDDEWETLKNQSDKELERIKTELATVTGEITRLVEVQALIATPPTMAEEAVEDDEVEVVEETDDGDVIAISPNDPFEVTTEESSGVGAPKFTPRGADVGSPSETPRTLHFPTDAPSTEGLDELDFLKSVSEDDAAGPSALRASGEFATLDSGSEDQAVGGAETTATEESGSADTPPQAKTLKCGECGELNRPTEWYCERCGAELASL
jgi:hypothetical protein